MIGFVIAGAVGYPNERNIPIAAISANALHYNLCIAAVRNWSAIEPVTVPAGWTLLFHSSYTSPGSVGVGFMVLGAPGSVGSGILVINSARDVILTRAAYSGTAFGTEIVTVETISEVQHTNSVANVVVPAVGMAWTGNWLLTMASGRDNNGPTIIPDASEVTRASLLVGSLNNLAVNLADCMPNTSGSSGTKTFSASIGTFAQSGGLNMVLKADTMPFFSLSSKAMLMNDWV